MIQTLSDLVRGLDETLKNINTGLERAWELIEEEFVVLDRRLQFHYVKGLQKVKYIMEHDFVRGWMIFEERTLPYVCVEFKDVSDSFKRSLSLLNESVTDEERVKAGGVWLVMKESFLKRLGAIDRARNNVMKAHNSFITGAPLLTYEASRDRRYDMSYITIELLQAIRDNGLYNQDKFYAEINTYLDMVRDAIETYIDLVENNSSTYAVDQHIITATDEKFDFGCRYYNFNVFLFKTRIVNLPVNVISEKIQEFERRNRTLHDARAEFGLEVEETRRNLEHFYESTWKYVLKTTKAANDYLKDTRFTKSTVANIATSQKVREAMDGLELFMRDLRFKGNRLLERLEDVRLETRQMWKNLLGEYTTINFYSKVYQDFSQWKNTSDSFYIPYFAGLLNANRSFVSSLDPEELTHRLNADFHELNITYVLAKVNMRMHSVGRLIGVVDKLGTVDEGLRGSLRLFSSKMARFQEDTDIDSDFFL